MNKQPAPVAIFTYKRYGTLIKLIESLRKNALFEQTQIYFFSDGAKTEKDIEQIQAVRNYITSQQGANTHLKFSDTNSGLAQSIITGVTGLLYQYENVIVLEDDLEVTPNFLDYMNASLTRYADEKEVFSVSGYSFDLKGSPNYAADTYFLNRGWSWGWGTWRDRWADIDWEVKDYPQFRKDWSKRRAFKKGGSDLNRMLRRQIKGDVDSWAIRWFYHQFKIGGVTLYPVYSQVYNNGFDEFATHTKGSAKRFLPKMDQSSKSIFKFPDEIAVDPVFLAEFQSKMSITQRLKFKIMDQLSKLGL